MCLCLLHLSPWIQLAGSDSLPHSLLPYQLPSSTPTPFLWVYVVVRVSDGSVTYILLLFFVSHHLFALGPSHLLFLHRSIYFCFVLLDGLLFADTLHVCFPRFFSITHYLDSVSHLVICFSSRGPPPKFRIFSWLSKIPCLPLSSLFFSADFQSWAVLTRCFFLLLFVLPRLLSSPISPLLRRRQQERETRRHSAPICVCWILFFYHWLFSFADTVGLHSRLFGPASLLPRRRQTTKLTSTKTRLLCFGLVCLFVFHLLLSLFLAAVKTGKKTPAFGWIPFYYYYFPFYFKFLLSFLFCFLSCFRLVLVSFLSFQSVHSPIFASLCCSRIR